MSRRGPSLTLARFFAAVLALMAAVLVGLVLMFYRGSRQAILAESQRSMAESSRHVVDLINRHLAEAEEAVSAFERRLQAGLVRPGESVEADLLGALLGNPHLTELTFTQPAGQSSAFRVVGAAPASIVVRRVFLDGPHWSAQRRVVGAAGGGAQAAWEPRPALDPTAHDTYRTPVKNPGRALWSDLAFSQLDAELPMASQRRVVTVQKALPGSDERFVSVLRVGLQSDRVDELTRAVLQGPGGDRSDPHRVFVCDRQGRLISKLGPADTFALLNEQGQPDPDGDVRVLPASLPADVEAALALPALRELRSGSSLPHRLVTQGNAFLASFTALPEGRTQDWVVGVTVPEAHYLAALQAARLRLLAIAAAAALLAGLGGAIALRKMRGDLRQIVEETSRMRAFDFGAAPAAHRSFRDVAAVIDSLEQAKTALRALTKYVPLDLVRQLYEARAEPVLSSQLQEVSIMFTDVEGFTSVSERMSPDLLAAALGRYLETMTAEVHATAGIIDKYTGDGLMALWNAPRPCPGHAARACEAALRCVEATQALFASTRWADLRPWHTRFGIHRAEANVGHFGAPDRMSFTAMGDGVNLAARLESLNKQYGTRILVSAAVREQAGGAFLFRRLDRVAVKGKREGVEVYELLGRSGGEAAASAAVKRYEEALDAYFARRFAAALEILSAGEQADPPSTVLARRCRDLLTQPPPHDWNGVYVAAEK